MGNISYFCIVKQIKGSFNIVFVSLLLMFSLKSSATESVEPGMDSVTVSLLTCGPGSEVWSLYGHTAIRIDDRRSGQDMVVNYGMFSFRQKYFIFRFVFGLTDYSMGITSMDNFIAEYSYEGRTVVQQDLNLTDREKESFLRALYENALPQNASYRYNFFYDNCTTRARNILINSIDGKVEYSDTKCVDVSYRSMTHQWNEPYPWSRWGNDILLGVKADFDTDRRQQQFLPDSLRKDFDNAWIVDKSGSKRKLVANKFILISRPQTITADKQTDFCRPAYLFGSLFIITLLTSVVELRKKKTFWWFDLLLLLATGTAGLILLAMVFSQHPTVNVNFQIFVFNPLSLFLLYPVIRKEYRSGAHWYWKLLALCVLAFFVCGFAQQYAEGMYFVALSLLVRCAVNVRRAKL